MTETRGNQVADVAAKKIQRRGEKFAIEAFLSLDIS